jgi:hypothetical protein
LAEIAEANFTLVNSGAWLTPTAARAWDPLTRLQNTVLALEAAEAAGLVVMFAWFAPTFDNSTGEFTTPINESLLDSTSPAMWGFQLMVWCALSVRKLHSRMPLVPTPVFTPLTGCHCKLRPNTKG